MEVGIESMGFVGRMEVGVVISNNKPGQKCFQKQRPWSFLPTGRPPPVCPSLTSLAQFFPQAYPISYSNRVVMITDESFPAAALSRFKFWTFSLWRLPRANWAELTGPAFPCEHSIPLWQVCLPTSLLACLPECRGKHSPSSPPP